MREISLHGRRVAYQLEGSGPALVLIHGITSTCETWDRVLPVLARRFTVLAPDLLGHGGSAKPRGDYSLGAFASGTRDLMVALGIDRATICGHSLGGGVAMQLAYQFPELTERLVLVSSGGLGREVSVLLRSATLPGAELVLPLITGAVPQAIARGLARAAARVGLRPGEDLAQTAAGIASLRDPYARRAFLHTVRTILEPGGQRVSATDRLYLTREMPTLLVWGEDDPMIPADHGRSAHAAMPGSRLHVLPGVGHFPHRAEPVHFADLLSEFIDETEPSSLPPERLRELLTEGP